jgi:hypothetical protein
MRLTDKIASLPPAAVSIGFLAIFIASGVTLTAFPLGGSTWVVIYAAIMTILMTLVLAWHYSIYRAASDRSEAFVGHRGRRGFLFAICAVATAIFLAASVVGTTSLSAVISVVMSIACFSYFAAIWAAANALTRFDEQKKSVETHKTLGSFILQLYFFIGVWFIYPRIKRVLTTPPSEDMVR